MNTDFHPDKRVRLKVTVLHSLPLTDGNKVACTRALVTVTKALKELEVERPNNLLTIFEQREGDRDLVLVRVMVQNPMSAVACAALIIGAHEAVSSTVKRAKKVECEVGVM